jgi:beta-galactosidase
MCYHLPNDRRLPAGGLVDYRIKDQRLLIDGTPLSLFSGSFQYWRVEPELWAPILDRVKGMGFSIIETYIPWSVHEVAPREFDFGSSDRHRDIRRFLDVCHGAGVKVLARPGPHINAEMTYFGYPARLFAEEDLLARCADGSPVVLPAPPRMFPLPCYHHPRFRSEVRTWLEALAGELGGAETIWPDGPVIALQADNECSKFMRAHPFDWDYSQYAIELYRSWMESRYGTIDELNGAYGTRLASWALLDPPRELAASKPPELLRMLDWCEFAEHYIAESVRFVADILRELFGKGVPLFHNYPVTLPLPPLDMTAMESFLDFQSVDAYPQKTAYHNLRAGVKFTSAMSRLPVMAEFSSGGVYYAMPLALDDQEFTTSAMIMHGIKGANFYMIVERERWYGSPVKRDGSMRPRHYEFYRRLLDELRSWEIEEMTVQRDVLLLAEREYERLAGLASVPCPASRLLAQFAGSFEGAADAFITDENLGLSEPVAGRYARLLAFWYWALTATGTHFAIGDSAAGSEVLGRHKVVIVPTFEFMDASLQEKLLEYARSGGTVMVGPRAPRMDARMRPCGVLAEMMHEPEKVVTDEMFGARIDEASLFGGDESAPSITYKHQVGEGWLVHVGLVPGAVCSVEEAAPFAAMVDTLMRVGGVEPSFVPGDARADVSVFKGEARTVLFVANPTDETISTDITHTRGLSFKDLRTGERCSSPSGLSLTLPPYSIKVLGSG